MTRRHHGPIVGWIVQGRLHHERTKLWLDKPTAGEVARLERRYSNEAPFEVFPVIRPTEDEHLRDLRDFARELRHSGRTTLAYRTPHGSVIELSPLDALIQAVVGYAGDDNGN